MLGLDFSVDILVFVRTLGLCMVIFLGFLVVILLFQHDYIHSEKKVAAPSIDR